MFGNTGLSEQSYPPEQSYPILRYRIELIQIESPGSPFWGDTKTTPICGEYLTLLCLVVPILIWSINPLRFRRRPFFFFFFFWSSHTSKTENPLILQWRPFFWSSPIYGTKKGATSKSRHS